MENPDILASVAKSAKRPPLLVGFAAETNDVIAHAQAKLARKGCDLIVANDVPADPMGGETNRSYRQQEHRRQLEYNLPRKPSPAN